MGGRRAKRAAPPIFMKAREARRPLYICGARVLCSLSFNMVRVCCALLSAAHASARPGSAPAGKPPAKRLGKHTYAASISLYDLFMIFI